jgi:hypothetical protein
VIANVTDIIITVAAVIGLVPLGVRTVHDMIKNHLRKKSSEMWLTVALSVIASHAAPAMRASSSPFGRISHGLRGERLRVQIGQR